MECDKQYLRERDMNCHIREKHDFSRYTCTRCLASFTRPYNLTDYLKRDCQAKVGLVPIIAVQSIPDYRRRKNYTIPTMNRDSMPLH